MKFKNFEGVEYEVIYAKPHGRYHASGLCDNPNVKHPSIIVDPTLQTRRQLNVLIEEAFHAHLYDLPEYKVINLTVGLVFGILFSMGILLILSIFFIVLIPFLFYLTTRQVIKQLIVIK